MTQNKALHFTARTAPKVIAGVRREMMADCPTCRFPGTRLWTYRSPPEFLQVAVGNWMLLEKCPTCGQLWCQVPHEPYASFKFWTAWPSTEDVWRILMEKHEGKLLHEWHNWVIYEDYEKVDDLERKTIEAWRERTYNNFNPIDSPSRDLLNSSDEIEMHIRMVAEQ